MGLSENEDLTINYMMFPVDLVNMFEKISIFANIGWLPTITSWIPFFDQLNPCFQHEQTRIQPFNPLAPMFLLIQLSIHYPLTIN